MVLSTIPSFVRRRGRITIAQQRALDTLWSCYGIGPNNLVHLGELFGRITDLYLEIGFGMGDALIKMAQTHPECDYLGVDVYLPGMGRLLLQLQEQKLQNVKVLCADIVEILQHPWLFGRLTGIYIFFPDPWPKKRHHKRRLIQPAFVELLAQQLKTGGNLWIATDWQEYADQILAVLEDSPQFKNNVAPYHFSPRLAERPLTKFEQRGQHLGHQVWDLNYQRL
ncbi:MAG: tRNA (guanosine(46)-N7)-methyltransferase TrmB [Beggiatoa sp. IS2]|nr:MAG: tRNA (guanosine(46)-N7)-methyltransferase TrmB [Beggiatoa sp. IS2]